MLFRSCADIAWTVTWGVSAVATDKTLITPRFSGTIPSSFTYCDGATTVPVTIEDVQGHSAVWNIDLIGILNGTATVPGGGFLVENSTGLNAGSIEYYISIPTCFTDGNLICQSVYTGVVINTAFGCGGTFQIVNNNNVNLNIAFTNIPQLASLQGGATTYGFQIIPLGCAATGPYNTGFANFVGPVNNVVISANTWVYGTTYPGELDLSDNCSGFMINTVITQTGPNGPVSKQCNVTVYNT